MSTSAVIKIEGVNYASVYKHSDGYPESTLELLEAFNKRFYRERGYDPTYKFAQLLRETVRSGPEYNWDMSTVTGWGVLDYNNVGDYTYMLNADGTVTVTERY
jgi:hypothetical protein